jgi:hypothetical protein
MSARKGAPLAGDVPRALAGAPDNLIHRNKSPNPALARVTARFDFENGGSPSLLKSVMQLPLPLALELLRRQAK